MMVPGGGSLELTGTIELPAPPRVETPSPQPKPKRRRGRRTAQLITPMMAAVEAVVRRHAAASLEMPSNPVLGQLIGGKGRQTAWRALAKLVAAGRLLIEVKDGRRRVWVRDTGHHTDWGAYSVSPHAPYTVSKRGEKRVSKEVVRPDIKEVDDQPARYRVEPQRLVATEAAEVCCWPMWGDDEAPTHMYCGTPLSRAQIRRRKPYCEAHS